ILWSLGHQLPMLRPSFPHVKTSESGEFLISRAPVDFGEWSFLHEKHGVLRVLRQEGEILHVAPVTKQVGQLSVDVSKVQLPEGQEFVSFFITPVFEDRRNLTFLNMTFGAELAFGTDNWLSLRHLPFGK